ncbi:serine hydrolase [Ilumatobacter nonamiensis]|uniref:serine hydrolase n=1 Tax=Ilumatobacter nonamiensis TaxID=467093 RepID=UPI0003471292|nr:serine hydrolase [Ilumatobacter nonamiensis]
MISTLADLRAWGQHLVDGSLLSPALQARRLQFHRFDGSPINAGYGLGILNVNEFVGHNGAIFGYSSVVLTRPQTGTQLAFVAKESTTSSRPAFDVALAMIAELYPDQVR